MPVLFHADGEITKIVCEVGRNYNFPVIIAHMGEGVYNPKSTEVAVKCAEENPNVYLDTSIYSLTWKIEWAIKKLGSKRFLYGSDGPSFNPVLAITKIRILKISEEEKKDILGRNAQRLLGI